MSVQVLVSGMFLDHTQVVEKMNLSTDAIIVNQCDEYGYWEWEEKGGRIRFFSMKERGVGLSRNNAMLRADQEISLFSDEDIVYNDEYGKLVQQEFDQHPEADMITFNFDVNEERRTYRNEGWKRVRVYNSGRYPTFSFAIRTNKMQEANVSYSLLFGGGAKYCNGEDSLFIRDCIRKGIRVYASPVVLGKEEGRPSTWFHGYDEKFFYDRGVLYHFLYGHLAMLFAYRFVLKYQKEMCNDIPVARALRLMKDGINRVP